MSDLRLWRREGIWQVSGTVKIPGRKEGVRVRESTGTSRLSDAETYRDKVRQETIDREIHGPGFSLTFADCVVIYLEKGGEKRFMKPILERFGETRISELHAGDVSKFALERYGHLAPASVKRFYYTPLNAAIRAGSVANNIAPRAFEAPKVTRKTVLHAPESWFPLFFARAGFRISLIVLFMTTTGSRVSEACRLTPADCDLDSDRPRALLRVTKNGKPRMVPLTPTLVSALRFVINNEGLIDTDRIFGYASRWSVNQAIERTCKRSPEIPYFSSHKLGRHAFAARILNKGGSLKQAQEAGGWASIQIVADVYGHLEHSTVDDMVRERGEKVSDAFETSPLKLPANASTFIYVIGFGPEHNVTCKIGHSRKPEGRLATLQVGNAKPIALLRKWKVPEEHVRDIEAMAHTRLRPFMEAGEWFTLPLGKAYYAVKLSIEHYKAPSKGQFAIGVREPTDASLTRGDLIGPYDNNEKDGKIVLDHMVGTTGIEPVTPTMSREASMPREARLLASETPENKGYSEFEAAENHVGTEGEPVENLQETKTET